MKTLGAEYTDAEYDSFMAVWRYSGYLMGIPETILFHDANEALKLYDVGQMCEPGPELEPVVMAHSLVNSAPLIAGKSEPEDRRALAKYVYRVSRGLIGKETADSLLFPPGLLLWSYLVVQAATTLCPPPEQIVSRPSAKQQLLKIHVLARYLPIRRGGNPLHNTRPRIRGRLLSLVEFKGNRILFFERIIQTTTPAKNRELPTAGPPATQPMPKLRPTKIRLP